MHTTAELDTHADTVALGKGALVTQDTGHTVTVHPFASGLSTIKQVPIVTAALAYDCPATLQTYILHFHQALYTERLQINSVYWQWLVLLIVVTLKLWLKDSVY